jgi:hypothetical protein
MQLNMPTRTSSRNQLRNTGDFAGHFRMNLTSNYHCHDSVAIDRANSRVLLPVLAGFYLLVAIGPVFGQAATLEAASKAGVKSKRAASDTSAAESESAKTGLGHDWVRVQLGDDGKPVGMQTAIVRYARKATPGTSVPPVAVDLIGAVHVGDVAYYRELNQRFKQYDALLYELVAPEGTVVERGRGTSNAHPVGAMQNGIKSLLELDHQLEEIDYTRPNFVHADMSPDQFIQAMKDRNESFLQMYFRLLGNAMAHQSEMTAKGESLDIELFAALFANDRPRRLKIALAKQLAEMESLMVSFGGEEGSVIISERNKMALKVLKEQMAAGKRKLGIFYGAGHLNDMDERLREDFQLEPVSINWLTAWNLAAKP